MNRRRFLHCTAASAFALPLIAAVREEKLDAGAKVLADAIASGQVATAVMHVVQDGFTWSRHFGKASSANAMFLLGSISKPICVTALMTLYDRGEFRLDDLLSKFVPSFRGDGRERISIHHLLTHTCGLPDQLPENNTLRKNHSPLSAFVEAATRTPLQFMPGSRYQYSSMGILLAAHVAERICGKSILEIVDATVLTPLNMKHSAQGLGRFRQDEMVPVQTERAAPESGGGDPSAKEWDWNSPYWRKLGAPWGGTHASAPDIARWLAEFLEERGAAVKPETARLMTTNRNEKPLPPRGLGFGVGVLSGSKGCSEKTFGHTGSTGTLCWADPETKTICVVLTSLPRQAASPHPRELAAEQLSAAVR